jgi:hypothetical protein
MSRVARHAPAGMVINMLKRGVERLRLFRELGDYDARNDGVSV